MTSASQRRLLLVDDDPRNLLALEALLSSHGHVLLQAKNGAEALEIFERDAPDIILCDLVMPDMDGVEVLGRVRVHPERNHTPVIMITGHVDREHRLRALRAGADEFLEKPLDDAILTARLNTLLRLKQSRDELASRHAALTRLQTEQSELMGFIIRDIAAPMGKLHETVEWVEGQVSGGSEELGHAFAGIRTELHRVASMIEDLSWVSRLETSTWPVKRTRVVANELVTRAVERVESLADDRGVSIDVKCREHVTLLADEGLLARVLDNLLDNALRYTPEGGRIEIDVRREDGVEIVVCNEGPAIAPLERERIFGKFVRGWTDPPAPGHPGLGLYLCKRAVHALQGEIEIVDRPGWATSFCIWLPGSVPSELSASASGP